MSTPKDKYNKHILAIMDRYARGEASEEDLHELDKWYKDFPAYKPYVQDMTEAEKELAQRRILEGINKRIEEDTLTRETVKPKFNYFRLITVVVMPTVLVLGLLFYGWYERSGYLAHRDLEKASLQEHDHTVLPGGNKATLTLADGSIVSLTDAPEGNIAEQGSVVIKKSADGQLIYHIEGSDGISDISSNVYNKIETPRGGQYQVRLPDGTVVWLNAASTLKYPANFAKEGIRRVELSGEAYFEVAKDKSRPFIVSCDAQDVEVLGTHFNLNAYPDDKSAITTLLEGSVRVSTPLGVNTVVLKPGEQAINKNSNIDKYKVNADYAVAWKEGYFRFNGKKLDVAMKEIARWYDVEIQYKKISLKDELLAGTISKYSDIKQVLKKMELAGAFRFSIENGRIIVE